MKLKEVVLYKILGIYEEDGVLKLWPETRHTSIHGIVHQAVLCALAEGSAWLALNNDKAIPTSVTGHFVRPAHPSSGELRAKIKTLSKGRTTALVNADIFQGKRLIATYRISFFIK